MVGFCSLDFSRYLWIGPSTGKTPDGTSVTGTITIPEVAHDTEEEEYVVCLRLHFIIIT